MPASSHRHKAPITGHACHIVELMAGAVARGILCPESDHRQQWQATLRNTVAHYSGGHRVGLS